MDPEKNRVGPSERLNETTSPLQKSSKTPQHIAVAVFRRAEARAAWGIRHSNTDIARKEHGQQETVMSALPTVWGTVSMRDLEFNARSVQSQIDNMMQEIYELRDRVRTLEKMAEKAAIASRSARPAIAKPVPKKAAKKARV